MVLTHMTGGNIYEALEECSKRTVLCGLRQQNNKKRMIMIRKARQLLCATVKESTHSFVKLSNWRAGNLLHVVCRKPQLFLSSVVTSPPEDDTGSWQTALDESYMHTRSPKNIEVHSPAALLFVHIQDECLFGETELIFPLGSVVIQSFDGALKHTAAGQKVSLFAHYVTIHMHVNWFELKSLTAWSSDSLTLAVGILLAST